jgi:putative redox protein
MAQLNKKVVLISGGAREDGRARGQSNEVAAVAMSGQPSRHPVDPGPRETVVYGSAKGFAQQISVGRHKLLADEPAAVGGTDTGPGPYDLLVSALGACTSMTVSLYARRKQWPLEGVTVRLRHSKIHAADCGDCEKQDGMLDRIELDVELQGALNEEQRARLLEIANICPVHKTLTSEINIKTRLV